jgi:hypothetical protein
MAFGSGPMPPIASVVVAQDGSGDYNGTTEECIQDAIDSLPDGGWVFIKEGAYTISNPITVVNTGLIISGSYAVNLTAGAEDVIMNISGEFNILRDMLLTGGGLTDGSEAAVNISADWIELRGLVFAQSHADAIRIIDAERVIVSECIIFLPLGKGINVLSVGTGGAEYLDILHNKVTGCGDYGIYLNGTAPGVVDYCKIVGNTVDSSGGGINETGTADYNLFNNNICENNTTNYNLLGPHSVIGTNGDW